MGGSSLIGLIFGAEFIVQLVVLMLLAASIWSWSIIFNKLKLYKEVRTKSYYFQKLFSSEQILGELYSKIKDVSSPVMPLERIFIAAMKELLSTQQHSAQGSNHFVEQIKSRIATVMDIEKNKTLDMLEGSLGYLATISSASPFIGLFGTVWGIMHSFQSIADAKNTSLAVVAPGIAEALFATALGLIAAIPALIFYNILSKKLQDISNSCDDFTAYLSLLIAKKMDN